MSNSVHSIVMYIYIHVYIYLYANHKLQILIPIKRYIYGYEE